MRLVREITVGDRAVVVRELSVGEIRQWLDAKRDPGDLVDAMLIEEVSLADLQRLTTLTAAEIEALCPSEIEVIVAAAKEINGRFFAMRAAMVTMGREILAAGSSA